MSGAAAGTTGSAAVGEATNAPSATNAPKTAPVTAATGCGGFWAGLGLSAGRVLDRQLFRLRLGRYWREVGDRQRTRLGWMRFCQLAHFARRVVRDGVEGGYAEFGVWRGGSLYLVASLWQAMGEARELHGFDSFQGLPEPDPARDGRGLYRAQFADTDRAATARFLAERGLDRVVLHEGFFADTIAEIGDRRLALCHIDADLYESVKVVLERTYDLVAPGGVLLFDDYRHPECGGATIAVEEFFAARREVIQQRPGIDCSAFVQKCSD